MSINLEDFQELLVFTVRDLESQLEDIESSSLGGLVSKDTQSSLSNLQSESERDFDLLLELSLIHI